VAIDQKEVVPSFPSPGLVEHDPLELWRTQLETAQNVIARAGNAGREIAAIGITNQRETLVAWNKSTGEPLCPALVWQDRRSQNLCEQLIQSGHEPYIQSVSGLRIDAYFSAGKAKWMLDHIPAARACAQAGCLALGTVDSWLLWNLTQGACFATDLTNASRTLLFNIRENKWDTTLLDFFELKSAYFPEVFPSSCRFGLSAPQWFGEAIPINGVAGDQQSALFGQACFKPGMAKNTYGTGCFALMNSGDTFQLSANGLITTLSAQSTLGSPAYAAEGSVFVGGAVVQWLRDGLHAFESSADIEQLARSVADNGGVTIVPAFSGLGAPYWQPDARGMITGLTRGTTLAHIARAALESIAFQSTALLQAMNRDARATATAELSELRVDGGASSNNLLMQFQADLLGIPVIRPAVTETTALGTAWLAALEAGIYSEADELASLWQTDTCFLPSIPRSEAAEKMAQWEFAVRQACVAQ
ncbi:MAG: glycerol kinase GlpK, partial [Pusillimonas sp.]|nr:glycerol kinase GlpK [Pusillimonas sp.]